LVDENDEFVLSMSIIKDMDLNDYIDFNGILKAAKVSSLSWEQKNTCFKELSIKFLHDLRKAFIQNLNSLDKQKSQVFVLVF